ncbi:DKNYY domain-containing protein [Providencia rettgeri]|uniref:DKNYY domain-containing protein n=1 Tax=Providencia rettgeri TaxID=587 RepID=UPI00235F2C0C|nr:DKNYY domain-containing protein [Providencia rettgeri]
MINKKIVAYISASILFLACLFLSGVILSMNKVSSFEISHEGERIGYSIFTRYNGKIYANIPSNGEYAIEEADLNSFKVLTIEGRLRDAQFAVDVKNSYCGNKIVPQFKPKTAKVIGNDYFTDGETIIYCSSISQVNNELSGLEYLWQTWLFGWELGEKPQSYYYPLELLPKSNKTYQLIGNRDILYDGEQVYFKGHVMTDAEAQNLHAVNFMRLNNTLWESTFFFHDGTSVYYQQDKLALKDNDDLYAFDVDNLHYEEYLFSPQSGDVAVNNLLFPSEFAPYQIISRHGAHVNHALFLSGNGVYFYDKKKEKIRRAGDNPFPATGCPEISPLIFYCDNKTYYVNGSEKWGSNRSPGLISRRTSLYQVQDESAEPWVKIGNVTNHHYAEVWRKGSQFYYFDRLGSSQLIFQTMYKIADEITVNRLLEEPLRPDDIRQMVKNGGLQIVSNIEILHAETKYKKGISDILTLFSNDD